ncbi:MAG: TIGR03619 family F420-dependent LLM class oxidoreductase, partial [Chloroflexia bacterium]|nr:TIGR03619 family F420-dependent LLM class oxidoreductase [Chloroflexia bacterium]
MRIGVTLPTTAALTEPEAMTELASTAEEFGYDSLWVSDHVLVPHGSAFPPEHQLDALATLGWLAARTGRIAIGASVLILPYRDPVPTAKALSTIDWLSGGRLIVGVGVGWLAAEFEALGIPFAERGARTDEAMRTLRNLWETERSSFEGRWTRYRDMSSYPKASPSRQGTIPLLVGGNTRAAIGRAARLGDGWHPLNLAPTALAV